MALRTGALASRGLLRSSRFAGGLLLSHVLHDWTRPNPVLKCWLSGSRIKGLVRAEGCRVN